MGYEYANQICYMLTKVVWKVCLAMADKKMIKTMGYASEGPKIANRNAFKIKLNRINDPSYFMELINNDHSMQETNKMLNVIASGGSGLNRNNFETIFKKYCYYIEKIPKRSGYSEATIQEKIAFLNGVTQIYAKMGNLINAHMVKTFNKVSDQVFKQLLESFQKEDPENSELLIENMVETLVSVSRFNKKKAIALYKTVQKHLRTQKALIKINKKTSILYFQLFSNTQNYNRLIIQTCIDTLSHNKQLLSLPLDQFLLILYSLASSQYPPNHSLTTLLLTRIKTHLRHTPSSSQSPHILRQNIRMLQSLSLLEHNMNLASAYLPELTALLQVELFQIGKGVGRMGDREFRGWCRLVRRAGFWDQGLLAGLVGEVLGRGVQELRELEEQGQGGKRMMTMDTFASALHTLATMNYRSQPLIKYFIQTVDLLDKKHKLQHQTQPQHPDNPPPRRYLFSPKHYSRVIWSLCVLGTKQQLSKLYTLISQFIQHTQNTQPNTLPLHQTLNFYYCYLLLKSYFPQTPTLPLSFLPLLTSLTPQTLPTTISQTHNNIYNTYLTLGIPTLKQHNISNLICDLYIPEYRSSDGQFRVENVVVDVHGLRHFMRNCGRVRGGGVLKGRLLREEGYVYQFVGVEEWGLAGDKGAFVREFMDTIARKYGYKIGDNALTTSQQTDTSQIKFRKGRNIRTNNPALQHKLTKQPDNNPPTHTQNN